MEEVSPVKVNEVAPVEAINLTEIKKTFDDERERVAPIPLPITGFIIRNPNVLLKNPNESEMH